MLKKFIKFFAFLLTNGAPARVEAPDGFYPNLLDENGQEVEVYEGMVSVKGAPIVFEAPWTGVRQN